MSSPASPETIALRLGLDVKELNRSCDEALLPSLANFVHPWREVFAHLLAPLDLDDIDSENAGRSEQTKRLASLHKWKVKCGGKATYGVLITALLNNRDVRNAENVCQQLLQHLEAFPHETLSLPSPSPVRTVGEPSCGLEAQINQLDQQYIEIEALVLKTIKVHEVPLDQVRNWIRFPPTSLRTQFAELLRQQARSILSAASIDELFTILSTYWNLFHPTLLQYLVNKLGDEDLKEKMDCYMDKLYRFRIQTTLGDFLDKWVGDTPPGYKEFTLELGEDWRQKTIEEFEQFRISLSRLQMFGGSISFMRTAKCSSVLIVLALPEHLFPINFRQHSLHKFFSDKNILRVIVDGQCVLDLPKLAEYKRKVYKLCGEGEINVTELSDLLNQPGMDPNFYSEDGGTPLWRACFHGKDSIVQLLIECGADVNLPTDDDLCESPLMTASSRGNVKLCNILLQHGAKVDYQSKCNSTALYLASQHGHKDVVELLLDNDANVDKPNMGKGFTALRVASAHGQTEVTHTLLDRGATVDYQDKECYTPLSIACQEGHVRVAKSLLLRGAAINHQTKTGWSPLHLACAHGHPKVVEMLIEFGAKLDIQTKNGLTAHDVASVNSHPAVCQLLEKPPQSPSAGISIHLEPVPVTSLQPVPVTSLQTFRQILEHGHQLSDVPKPAPPEESHTDEVHMQ